MKSKRPVFINSLLGIIYILLVNTDNSILNTFALLVFVIAAVHQLITANVFRPEKSDIKHILITLTRAMLLATGNLYQFPTAFLYIAGFIVLDFVQYKFCKVNSRFKKALDKSQDNSVDIEK